MTYEVIELSDLVPEKIGVGIQRNGHELMGYRKGRRCPVEVQAGVSAAYQKFMNSKTDTGDIRAGAALLLDRDILMVIIEGLELQEASILAGDTDVSMRIFKTLGWTESDEGEAPGAETTSPSTTETSFPDSTSSTEPEIGES